MIETRTSLMPIGGNRIAPLRKGVTALFLLKSSKPSDELLALATKSIRDEKCVVFGSSISPQSDVVDDSDDTIAMIGHRIGVLDDTNDFAKYLSDLHATVGLNVQLLLTVLKTNAVDKPKARALEGRLSGLQFQYGEFYGPYLAMFSIDIDSLRKQSSETSFQCTVIHEDDNMNYVASITYSNNELK